ncbi:hypothetical protein DT076_10260 [Desertihabitans brevis]|uniref:Uncharacterized protein n=1 Tax=Desertihabitans brevis TaxID=2268447 RepID=A0A367YXR8_9ACTN|nr:hypothetical protein [Desertihabitans brevis]RCK69802.1 hypothetical protein DT076_10260 [Desertihabitans brevis]
MWAFLSARLRMWLVFAVVVPLVTAVLAVVRRQLEKRYGPDHAVVRNLARLERFGRRRRR